MRVVVVTGTNTEVGKTIATAALVTYLSDAGQSVAMVKPAQTGTGDPTPTDAATVARLSGCSDVAELVTLEDALAPDSAARHRGISLPGIEEVARTALDLFPLHDLLVVEGAGGVLVRLDTDGGTLVELAETMADLGHSVAFVVVTTLALGTLNHTELTVDLLRHRGFEVPGLILGSVPDDLSLAEARNVTDLPRVTGLPVLVRLPAHSGALEPDEFQAATGDWFAPDALEILTGRQPPGSSPASS